MSAKLATSNNKPASVAVHGASSFYNIAQIARYGYLCAEQQYVTSNGDIVYDADIARRYRMEQFKHIVFATIDVAMLISEGLMDNQSMNIE